MLIPSSTQRVRTRRFAPPGYVAKPPKHHVAARERVSARAALPSKQTRDAQADWLGQRRLLDLKPYTQAHVAERKKISRPLWSVEMKYNIKGVSFVFKKGGKENLREGYQYHCFSQRERQGWRQATQRGKDYE
jgi:hypothetical protein